MIPAGADHNDLPVQPGAVDLTSLPQFVFCWSTAGLFGTGYGVRAASNELLNLSSHSWESYVAYCDFVPQHVRQEVGWEKQVPMAIGRYRLAESGFLITRKTPTLEDGTYFVHAIVDRLGLVDPIAIASSQDASFWLTSQAQLPSAGHALPSFPLELWAALFEPAVGAAQALDEHELQDIVDAFIDAHEEGRTAWIEAATMEALPRILALLCVLPTSLAAQLCFSTYEARDRPGTLDVIATPTHQAPANPRRWVTTLCRIARKEPEMMAAMRRDARVIGISELSELVCATHETTTGAAVRSFVESRSPFLPDLLARPETRNAVLEALDSDPAWWLGVGLDRLGDADDNHILGGPAEILRDGIERVKRGDNAAAGVLMRAYRTAQPELRARLNDLRVAADDDKAAPTVPIAAALLTDQTALSEQDLAQWRPWLLASPEQLAAVASLLPADLHRAILRHAIEVWGAGGARHLPRQAAPEVVAAVSDVAIRHDAHMIQNAAAFLVAYASNHRDAETILHDALRQPLPPSFVRGALSECLIDSHRKFSHELTREILQAGIADWAAFNTLVARLRSPYVAPPTDEVTEAPKEAAPRRPWRRSRA